MRRDMAVGANWFKDFLMKGIKMPKEEWGVKRICPTTGKRFYDLNKDPIVSPYTGEVVELDTSKTRMIAADAEDMSSKGNKAADLDADEVVLPTVAVACRLRLDRLLGGFLRFELDPHASCLVVKWPEL